MLLTRKPPSQWLCVRAQSAILAQRARRHRASSAAASLQAASSRTISSVRLNGSTTRRELERYDAQFARAATEAEDAARQVREARLAAQEAVSEARRLAAARVRAEAHHARRVAEVRDQVERERRDESLPETARGVRRAEARADAPDRRARRAAGLSAAGRARRGRRGGEASQGGRGRRDHDARTPRRLARKAEKEALERRVRGRRAPPWSRRRSERARGEAEAERAASEARRTREAGAPGTSWPRCEREGSQSSSGDDPRTPKTAAANARDGGTEESGSRCALSGRGVWAQARPEGQKKGGGGGRSRRRARDARATVENVPKERHHVVFECYFCTRSVTRRVILRNAIIR